MNRRRKPNYRNDLFNYLLHAWCICSFGCAVGPFTDAPAKSKESAAAIYSTIQVVAREILDQTASPGIPSYEGRDDPGTLNVASCVSGSDLGMPHESPFSYATMLALQIDDYREEFDELKIPPAVTARVFSMMENLAIETLQERQPSTKEQIERLENKRDAKYVQLLERMVKDLNTYGKSRKDLPRFVHEGGCGGGEVEVEIKTNPPGGTVSVISLFSYKLCQARGINPDDRERCSGWWEAVSVSEDLIGEYQYHAEWPDGKKKKGKFRIGKKTTITISPEKGTG